MGKQWKQWKSLFSWAPKSLQTVTSHEIKKCLLLGRKAMTNLDSLLKSRDITLPTKVHLVKAMVFSVVMYGCESWIIKKAVVVIQSLSHVQLFVTHGLQHRRNDVFELWCWRTLIRVPWTARRSNQSILKDQSWIFIGRTEAEAEAPVVWTPDAKSQLTGKHPDAGQDRRQEEKGTT